MKIKLLILLCSALFCHSNYAQTTKSLPNKITLAFDNAEKNRRSIKLQPIAEQIALRLGVDLEFYACPWVRCLKAIEKGQVDMIFSVFQTPERDNFMHFIEPALAVHPGEFFFWVNKDKPVQINRYDDLYKLNLVELRGNQYFPRYDEDNALSKSTTVDYQSAIKMVLHKRADAMIDLSLTPEIQKRSADPNDRLIRASYVQKEQIKEFIAISKHSQWGEHYQAVSKVLAELTQEGVVEEYLSKVTSSQ